MTLAELFDAHHDALFRYLARLCGDGDLAADAAQEAFVRVIERPPREGASRAWLFRVATNVMLEWLRTEGRRRRLRDALITRAPMADPAPDPHELVEARDDHTRVANALAVLSQRERMVLLMREEGFTHREIADAIGTTTGSVGTMIARALEHLERVLLSPAHTDG